VDDAVLGHLLDRLAPCLVGVDFRLEALAHVRLGLLVGVLRLGRLAHIADAAEFAVVDPAVDDQTRCHHDSPDDDREEARDGSGFRLAILGGE
jgi:hypothetical protein